MPIVLQQKTKAIKKSRSSLLCREGSNTALNRVKSARLTKIKAEDDEEGARFENRLALMSILRKSLLP